jgi:glycosyltransferase involved in cell wall biosynthesis
MFVYWGRRGALSQWTLELANDAGDAEVFSVSRQNELFESIAGSGASILPVDTFRHGAQSILALPRIVGLRRQIRTAIVDHRIEQVVVLMSHVWTPLISGAVRKSGARYVVVVHDARPHPGDVTALVNRWLLEDAFHADKIVTLSKHVADQLIGRFPKLADKTEILFHPVMGARLVDSPDDESRPIGFLFHGRLMFYKGLPIFTAACELLRARGYAFRVGIAGEGELGDSARALRTLDAEIVNRWIAHGEIEQMAARYDTFVLSNIEASQSGVIPLAHGLGLPVLTTPVGGLIEQVEDEHSGLIARDVSATALADIMERYLTNPDLRQRLRTGVAAVREQRSMRNFYEALTSRTA